MKPARKIQNKILLILCFPLLFGGCWLTGVKPFEKQPAYRTTALFVDRYLIQENSLFAVRKHWPELDSGQLVLNKIAYQWDNYGDYGIIEHVIVSYWVKNTLFTKAKKDGLEIEGEAIRVILDTKAVFRDDPGDINRYKTKVFKSWNQLPRSARKVQ